MRKLNLRRVTQPVSGRPAMQTQTAQLQKLKFFCSYTMVTVQPCFDEDADRVLTVLICLAGSPVHRPYAVPRNMQDHKPGQTHL